MADLERECLSLLLPWLFFRLRLPSAWLWCTGCRLTSALALTVTKSGFEVSTRAGADGSLLKEFLEAVRGIGIDVSVLAFSY